MKLTIFGGTGGVGSQLVPMALDAGHEVTAYVRSPEKLPRKDEVKVVVGELHDAAAIGEAIRGADAVLSALGARSNSADQVEIFATAMTNITEAMAAEGVQRLVAISGAGLFTPEDNVTLGRRVVRLMVHLLARHVAEAKAREYEILKATDLEWVLVRPPRIVDGPATGEYRVFGDRVPSPKISQGDVADLMLQCTEGDEWVRRAPIPGY